MSGSRMGAYLVHQMPWPEYPSDFSERFLGSTGDVPNTYFDPELGAELYDRYLDEMEMADELGFDGICVNEEHQNAYGGLVPSPNIIAATLARRTRRARIGMTGNCLPLRADPLRVAEEVAMLDVITRGRVLSGFVRGGGCEYFSGDANPTESRERFLEAHDLIIRAWTEPGPFEHVGRYFHYRNVNVWPRPYSKPHPAIWVPTAGSTESVLFAASHAYPFISVLGSVSRIKQLATAYRTAYEAAFNETPSTSLIGYGPRSYVAADDQQAVEEAAEHDHFFTDVGFRMPVHVARPPGYVSEESLRAFLNAGNNPNDIGTTIAGSPRRVVDMLIAHYDELDGFGFLLTGTGPGNATREQVATHLTLLATEVLPVLNRYHAQREAARQKDGRRQEAYDRQRL